MKDKTNPTENVEETFKKFARINTGKDAQANEFQAAETRGRTIMANTPAEAAKTKPVPVQGFVKNMQDATARGREQMETARRGERNFPPARQVVKP